jgi:hypothetical protein
MEAERHRSVFWPIVLILVGIGLLLNQLGLWAIDSAALWRLWPVALVLIGLDILLSRTRWGRTLMGAALLVLGALVFYTLGVRPGAAEPIRTEQLQHPAAGIASASLSVQVGAGSVTLTALDAPGNLYEAQIRYDPKRTSLSHTLDVQDGQATLALGSVSQRQPASSLGWKLDESWSIALNRETPWQVEIAAGIQRADLALRRVSLSHLSLRAGVGDVYVALPSQGEYSATIEGGIGQLRVDAPVGIPARVFVQGGLGTVTVDPRFQREGQVYTTADYRTGQAHADITVKGGIGSITIR